VAEPRRDQRLERQTIPHDPGILRPIGGRIEGPGRAKLEPSPPRWYKGQEDQAGTTRGRYMAREDLPRPDAELIDAFVDHLALERHLSEHTVSAYRRDLAQLAGFLGRQRRGLRTATYPVLRRFLAHQATLGYARASVARRVAAVRTFYRWAAARGIVAADPAELLGRPKVVSRLPSVLRPADAARLVEAPVAGSGEGSRVAGDSVERAIALRDRAVLELMYGSGIRVGEVSGLTLDRLDLDRGRVLVSGKGSKEREVPLSEPSSDALERYLRLGRAVL